jgi:catechol 2,3-dioxygenase-like lactoylglutathione lyase family enzyme
MLSRCRVHAALPAADLQRARRFYEEKLGLRPTQDRQHGLRYELGNGSAMFLFPSTLTSRGGHTQAGIEVDDIHAAVRQLKSRGVTFEEYTGDVETSDGVATEPDGSTAAWFKDSEGNLLVLVQFS